jgi:hypothetical protein
VIAQSKKYNSVQYSAPKLRLALEHLALARKGYNELKLRDGFAALEIARLNADEAYIGALKGTAQTEIDASARIIQAAGEVSDEEQMAPNELEGARALLATASYRNLTESFLLNRLIQPAKPAVWVIRRLKSTGLIVPVWRQWPPKKLRLRKTVKPPQLLIMVCQRAGRFMWFRIAPAVPRIVCD